MSDSFREYLSKAVKANNASFGEASDPRTALKKHPLGTGTKDNKCRCCGEETCQCHPLCPYCGGAYTCRDAKNMKNAKKGFEEFFTDTRKGAEAVET